MFSLLLELSDGVSAFIIGFDFLSHPVVCLVVVNPDTPRHRPEAVVYPTISPPLSPHLLWSQHCCGTQRVSP